MAFGKDQQPTTSSPPPQVISPTVAAKPIENTASPENIQSKKLKEQPSEEIKAPRGIVPGVPLSELKEEVTQQQNNENIVINDSTQPSRMVELSLVTVQIIALIIIIVGFIPPLLWQNTFLQVVGMLLVGLGIFIGIWAVLTFKQKIYITPTPGPNSFLVTGGPFAYIRHPLYFSLLTGSVGLTLAYPTIPRLLALIVLAIILHIKVGYEEKMLAARFNGYDKYKQNTGALLPRIGGKKSVTLTQVSPTENKENTEE